MNSISAMNMKVDDVAILDGHVCVIKQISRAKPGRNVPLKVTKHCIVGFDIIDNHKYEILCKGADQYNKIIPMQCSMKVITINPDNTCDLQYDDDIIKNVAIPLNYRKKITEHKNDGLEVMVVVDNYLDKFYKIKNYEI